MSKCSERKKHSAALLIPGFKLGSCSAEWTYIREWGRDTANRLVMKKVAVQEWRCRHVVVCTTCSRTLQVFSLQCPKRPPHIPMFGSRVVEVSEIEEEYDLSRVPKTHSWDEDVLKEVSRTTLRRMRGEGVTTRNEPPRIKYPPKWSEEHLKALEDSELYYYVRWDPSKVTRTALSNRARRATAFSVRRLFQEQVEENGQLVNKTLWKRERVEK